VIATAAQESSAAAPPSRSPSQSPRRQAASAGGYERLSDERRRTAWAVVLRRSDVLDRPAADARRVGRVGSSTYLGSSETVLVLGVTADHEHAWSYVRYPGSGNRKGWIASRRLGPRSFVTTRLVIDRARQIAALFRHGRRVLRVRIGVGAVGSPTPAGRTYVRERIVPPTPDSIYGVLAFGLSAYSSHRSDWPGGGQVGVHGTNQPELIPGRISNGCVRVRDRDIRRIGRSMSVGAPVLIR